MDDKEPVSSVKSQEDTKEREPSPTRSQSIRDQSVQRYPIPTRDPSDTQEPQRPPSPMKYPRREPSIQRPLSISNVREPSLQKSPSSRNSYIREPPILKSPSPTRKSDAKPPSFKMSSNGADEMSNRSVVKSNGSGSPNRTPEIITTNVSAAVASLEPKSKNLSDHINELTETVNKLSRDISNPLNPVPDSNIDKIANMSKVLTDEASALRQSIRCLTEDIVKTKQQLFGCCQPKEDVNFPYHLFLIEIIINKIHMKCDCFDIDFKNLVITATFLGKQPIVLYDSSCGKLYNLSKINMGKSILFAMTYDKICSINDFEVFIELTKQPACTTCIQRIGETRMDYTNEFRELREDLCKKWMCEQPQDNISCTTSTPLSKNMYYVTCGDLNHQDSIGVIEVSVRMSFLGKEVTTAFSGPTHSECTSSFAKGDRGMAMYSCQNVEMDDQGKVLLDEEVFNKRSPPCQSLPDNMSVMSPVACYQPSHHNNRYDAGLGEFRIRDLNDEINKLMREKRHWEVQIKSLGGPDHARVGPRMLDQDGKEVPGNRGYKYFGAAKDLPGVRELFEQEPPPPPRRTRADLMRDVDADYYGYRDDDDGMLLPLEKDAEIDAIAKAVEEWKNNKEQNKDQEVTEEENIYPEDPEDKRMADEDDPIISTSTSLVAVPSQKDIEEALLRRKKQELLEKYGCLDVKMES